MRKATCPKVLRSKYFRVTIILFFLLAPGSALAYGTDYRFTGKPLDRQTDLYYFNQRYYDPKVGRFIQPDPLANFLATPDLQKRTGQKLEDVLANPQRLNSYSYSLNNPVNVIDPSGEAPIVSQARQERFDKISDYIRNNEDYWLVRDRDGNAKALDLIWQKSLELSENKKGKVDLGKALDTFYDAVNIDWAHDKTLDLSREDYLARINNLPSSLIGYFGNTNNYLDKLQHFAMSAKLTNRYGPRIASLFGRLKETRDGIRALFNREYGYRALKQMDEGYSQSDLAANSAGIMWVREYRQAKVMPSVTLKALFGDFKW